MRLSKLHTSALCGSDMHTHTCTTVCEKPHCGKSLLPLMKAVTLFSARNPSTAVLNSDATAPTRSQCNSCSLDRCVATRAVSGNESSKTKSHAASLPLVSNALAELTSTCSANTMTPLPDILAGLAGAQPDSRYPTPLLDWSRQLHVHRCVRACHECRQRSPSTEQDAQRTAQYHE